MSTPTSLLSKCSTNAYILHDFAEIAYIVCTLATPGGAQPSKGGTSPDSTLVRLQNAEKQFRQASILVALDEDKLELFTFYKKIDVLKDQKAILNRFGQVCRLNSCIIARKSAARILDLLKPESNRVYQLFTTAILSSVQLGAYGPGNVINITPTIALVAIAGGGVDPGFEPVRTSRLWQLKRVSLQMLASGQLVLTIQQARSGPLVRLSDLIMRQTQEFRAPIPECILYLTPTGQLARYKGGWYGRTSELSHVWNALDERSDHNNSMHYQWTETLLDWFSDRPNCVTRSDTDLIWVEIEIPLFEIATVNNDSPSRSLIWKSLLWPADLIHLFQRTLTSLPKNEIRDDDYDPLDFVQDWLNTTAERNSSIYAANVKGTHRFDSSIDKPFNDNMAFEDQELTHAFGPQTSAPSQIIYPTPPDGPITHPTPGVSSVDGLAPTPFAGSQQALTAPEISPELDMQHNIDAETSMQSSQDPGEDLFGELHDDDFAGNETGDEPNWDFFDQPTFNGQSFRRLGRETNEIQPNPEIDSFIGSVAPGAHHLQISEADSSGGRQPEVFQTTPKLQQTPVSGVLIGEKNHEQFQHEIVSVPISVMDDESEHSTRAGLLTDATSEPHQMFEAQGQKSRMNSSPFQQSRRSSAYNNAQASLMPPNRDTKYKSEGKYWFQPFTAEVPKRQAKYPLSMHTRPLSSGSDTSMSSWASGASIGNVSLDRGNQTLNNNTWVDYHLPLEDGHKPDSGPINEGSPSPELLSLLEIIATAPGDEPFLLDVSCRYQSQPGPVYKGQTATMIAQVLVDQVTQSSFFKDVETLFLQHHSILSAVEVSMDHNETRTIISSSTLGDLTNIQSPSSAIGPSNKLNSLRKPQVVICRGEDQIKADSTILQFWDVLSLQPVHGHKNLYAFCMYPSQPKITDPCKAFLNRIADTYTAGNFGTHLLGTIDGYTSNGLLIWPGNFRALDALNNFVQALGPALAASTDIDGTIVIYMVCPDSNFTTYKEICHAFALLFEAFARTVTNTRKVNELVLQLVPISFVAGAHNLVSPAQQRYTELAIEVYNRIPGMTGEKSPASCEMAVTLEQAWPRSIDFELTVDSMDPLSRDGAYLHLAYAYSRDGRWLVAAWTDASGKIALTMPYSLRSQGNDHRVRREVFREMWEISNDIMSQETLQWRLAIARSGYFELDELNDWLQLINQSNQDRKSLARIILMSIQLDPSIKLSLKDSMPRPSPISVVGGANPTGTPVTTPQNNTTSPDHGVAATPTPGGASLTNALSPSDQNFETPIENDAVLVDPQEDSWSVVLGFGLNQATDSISIRPAGASALLFKATQLQDQDQRLTSIEVGLLVTSRSAPVNPSQSERESILQSMLEQFRRLITLAEIRGSINRDRECVPWHIATAVKGANILSQTL